MDRLSPRGRRQVVGGLAALVAMPARAATVDITAYGVVVAGPAGGRTDRWADLLVPAIGRGFASRSLMVRQNLGGIDGVTGANQFEARVEPDGTTGLLVPGVAMLSWLTGEMRARFDPARWVPLWVGLSGVVLFSRTPLVQGQPFRMTATSPAGPELPALLALDILGIDVELVPPDLPGGAVLVGPFSSMTPALATQAGFRPVMTFGILNAQGTIGRDPDYPDVPTAFELTIDRAPKDTLAALRSAALATQLDVGLVLPALTPAASVALWRRACAALPADPVILEQASRTGTRQPSADQVAMCTTSITGTSGTLLTLRRWLATRYDWRPA